MATESGSHGEFAFDHVIVDNIIDLPADDVIITDPVDTPDTTDDTSEPLDGGDATHSNVDLLFNQGSVFFRSELDDTGTRSFDLFSDASGIDIAWTSGVSVDDILISQYDRDTGETHFFDVVPHVDDLVV